MSDQFAEGTEAEMDQLSHFSPIPRTTVADGIVDRLVSHILGEGLKPGYKLPPERELMKRFSVGRSTLREAIKMLSAAGIVEVLKGKGMFVGRGETSVLTKPLSWGLLMSSRNTREVMESRRVIEVELAGLAAKRAPEEAIEAIGEQLSAMQGALDDVDAYSRHDVEFHLMVARAADNRVLCQVLNTVQSILRVLIREVVSVPERPVGSLSEHLPIYEAIRARDAKGARQAMAAHLDGVENRLHALLSKGQAGTLE